VCADVSAAFWAGVGFGIPVYHDVSLGSRLDDLLPGGGGSHRGGAGVGIDSDEEAAWHSGATAFHRLPDTIWSHLAQHFRTHARTVTRPLAEVALSRGAVVCIPGCTGWRVHLSTTTCASAPVCWEVQSRDTTPGCSH